MASLSLGKLKRPAGSASWARSLGAGSKAISWLLGSLVLASIAVVAFTDQAPGDVAGWAIGALGSGFVIVAGGLTVATLTAWVSVAQAEDVGELAFWHQAGSHAAGGVATAALTWTLLGISLGIGTLAEADLSPETVGEIISSLTAHFSMAFMTTVIGLPLATTLRAMLSLTAAKRKKTLVAQAQAAAHPTPKSA